MAKSELEKKLGELNALRAKGVVTDEEYDSRRSALLADTAAPLAQGGSKAGGIFKWGLLGCLGMFAAVGLLFIVVIALIAAAVGAQRTTLRTRAGTCTWHWERAHPATSRQSTTAARSRE
jgi:hypothetical protein